MLNFSRAGLRAKYKISYGHLDRRLSVAVTAADMGAGFRVIQRIPAVTQRGMTIAVTKKNFGPQDRLLAGLVGVFGGTVMLNGLNAYRETSIMHKEWKYVPGRILSFEIDPVRTSRELLSREQARFNAIVIYEYDDEDGKARSGRFQAVISAEGSSSSSQRSLSLTESCSAPHE